MAKAIDQTFQLRLYPLPKIVVRCIKCGRQAQFDRTQLIEKLGETYPVYQAVKRLTCDWECKKPDGIPAYKLHPDGMHCLPHLPEWEERVRRFSVDANNGRKPEPLYAEPETKAPPA
jgi:hypothetical protein